jgi:hydroxymethylglutaryl-CoA reductase
VHKFAELCTYIVLAGDISLTSAVLARDAGSTATRLSAATALLHPQP